MSYRSASPLIPLAGLIAVAACSPRIADDPRLEAPTVQVATVAPSQAAAPAFRAISDFGRLERSSSASSTPARRSGAASR
jgi:hypothetical protein